jgi:hypothetical protein
MNIHQPAQGVFFEVCDFRTPNLPNAYRPFSRIDGARTPSCIWVNFAISTSGDSDTLSSLPVTKGNLSVPNFVTGLDASKGANVLAPFALSPGSPDGSLQ